MQNNNLKIAKFTNSNRTGICQNNSNNIRIVSILKKFPLLWTVRKQYSNSNRTILKQSKYCLVRTCRKLSDFLALGLDDLTLWSTELFDHRKLFYCFWCFCDVFCQPSGSILHSKNDLHTVPSGKVQNAHLFGPIVLAATASSWCWRRFKWWCHGPSNQIYTWTKRRRRWVVARAQQSACESAHTKVSALQSNFPTTQCRRHTNTWSTSIKKKKKRCEFALPRGPLL